MSKGRRIIRPFLEEFQVANKKVFILAEGRLVNLGAAEGHLGFLVDHVRFPLATYLLQVIHEYCLYII